MEQLLCHIFGDYFLQSDWMALNKSKRTFPCLIHVVLYSLPFLFLTNNIYALILIASTHFVFDRFSLVKYVVYAKNFLNPSFSYYEFSQCDVTGYYDDWKNPVQSSETEKIINSFIYLGFSSDFVALNKTACRPKFITTWLYIISDNWMHLLCNYFILLYFKPT
jgi:uncharacterized membrane protein